MAARVGSAEWRGDLKGGNGTLKAGDGGPEANYTFLSRFEEGDGTNPEELIGAALAACFSMAISNQLSQDGHTPEYVRTTASVSIRQIDEKPTIATIALETEGKVPGIDQERFTSEAELTKDGCIIARALGAVPEITVAARLVS